MVIFYDNIDATVDVVGVDFDVDTWCLFRLFFAILMLMLILLFRTDPSVLKAVLKAVLMAVLMVVLFFNNYNEDITDNAKYSCSIAASGNSCSRIFCGCRQLVCVGGRRVCRTLAEARKRYSY